MQRQTSSLYKILFLGLLPREECSKPECTSTQDPTADNCHSQDGYQRTLLYRSWNTSCPGLQPDFTKTYTYPWLYHGTWHWGSTVQLRCLPGYAIPDSYKNVSVIRGWRGQGFRQLCDNICQGLRKHSKRCHAKRGRGSTYLQNVISKWWDCLVQINKWEHPCLNEATTQKFAIILS